jgi:GH15 family glucan-1,4-alpha-glucosidase
MENHVGGHVCRFGIWIHGTFFWIDSSFRREIRYRTESLVTEVVLSKPGFPVTITVNDCVHHTHPVFLRRILIQSTADYEQDIRIFLSHDFHIGDVDKANTAFYHPGLDAVVHYKKDRFFLIGGMNGDSGISRYAVGVTEFANLAGAYVDAEDGELSGNAVAHGSVDSVISFRTRIPASGTAVMHTWICAGKSIGEVSLLQERVRKNGAGPLLGMAENYFRLWVNKNKVRYGDLPAPVIAQFKRSLLILRSQIDNRGGIIASCDSDILRFNKDTYDYVWPRDGAFVAIGLDAAGYHGITRKFFSFCRDALDEEGFLYQKYNPDGSWGSTWHPWVDASGNPRHPIQEDETALVLFALWRHYDYSRDIEFITSLYEPLICRAADFLARYRDPETGLPLPSYDVWEEHYGVFTYTASAVYGGLVAASWFAALFGDKEREDVYARAAGEVKAAITGRLFDERSHRFLKGLIPQPGGGFRTDDTIDSSLFGVFGFGVLPAGDPLVKQTMTAIESALWVPTAIGGCARYTNDLFQRMGDDRTIPGNPWPICTLWLADWYIAREEREKGMELLLWVIRHASPAGLLAEQLHPDNGMPLSVSPLTWSHSAFVGTVIRYLNLIHDPGICPECGLPAHGGPG